MVAGVPGLAGSSWYVLGLPERGIQANKTKTWTLKNVHSRSTGRVLAIVAIMHVGLSTSRGCWRFPCLSRSHFDPAVALVRQ